jgi:hypothetical protein
MIFLVSVILHTVFITRTHREIIFNNKYELNFNFILFVNPCQVRLLNKSLPLNSNFYATEYYKNIVVK